MERASLVLRAATASAVMLLAAACGSSTTSSTPSSSPMPQSTTAAASAPPAGAPSASPAAAACGNGTPPTVSGTGPADTTGAAGQIATDFTKFFDPSTSATDKMGLLQNAQKLAPAMQAFGKDPQAAMTSVGVTAVDFTDANTAGVSYNVCLGGTVALQSKGKSVLEGGVWKVADTTLCSLLSLKSPGTPIPGCS